MMPTHKEEASFWRDWNQLTQVQQNAFVAAVEKMVEDLKSGRAFWKSLRIKGVQGDLNIFEMTWASDGRATFRYGISPHPGDAYIIW